MPVRPRSPAPYRGVEQLVARRAHNPEVEGSSPSPATKYVKGGFSYVFHIEIRLWFFGTASVHAAINGPTQDRLSHVVQRCPQLNTQNHQVQLSFIFWKSLFHF